jgi:hypothetical protein
VFQLRLPALRIEQLRRIAAERGVSPGALAVDWVVDRLDREDTPTGPLPVVDGEDQSRGRGLRRLGRRQPPETTTRAGDVSSRQGLPVSAVGSTAPASAR